MTQDIRLGLLVAALLPALAACQKPAPPADAAKETAAINAQNDAFNAAAKTRDVEKAVAIDAADIRGYGGGGPDVTSKDDDLKSTRAAMADPAYAFSVKPEHTEVAKSGDIAFQTGVWESQATNPSTKAVERSSGHFVVGWRKDAAGTWRLAAVSASGPTLAAPAAAPAADKK